MVVSLPHDNIVSYFIGPYYFIYHRHRLIRSKVFKKRYISYNNLILKTELIRYNLT